TVRRLHPEDRVGVLSYDSQPIEVVPMQEAKYRERIERSIERIEARGSTDIKAALELAGRTLGRETSAVKTIVLLSDGETPPFNIRAVCEELVAAGISVNTIGVGSRFDWSTLTQIAKYGRGTGPIPAYNASQIPSVMVDVASKIMTENKTRSIDDVEPADDRPPEDDRIVRPENLIPDATPRPTEERSPEELLETDPETRAHPVTMGRPTVYLDEIPWDTAPALRGRHLAQDKPGTWVSLRVDERLPLVAHWSRGEGRVIMAAVPSEGAWSEALTLWDGYAAWTTQMLRFVEQPSPLPTMDLDLQVSDQQLRVQVQGAGMAAEATDWTFRVDDLKGMVPISQRGLGPDEFLLSAEAPWLGEFLNLQINGTGALGELQHTTAVFVPPPQEVRHRGIDLRRLEAWRNALDAEIVSPALRASTPTEAVTRRRRWTESQRAAWLPWLLLLLLPELLLKRWLRHDD
ncbi:MAG: VWA domain-containing protein, partial [Planctomycetes bacterium]|nr:VWA domain-containing protein [Planctomycetota bacterium]